MAFRFPKADLRKPFTSTAPGTLVGSNREILVDNTTNTTITLPAANTSTGVHYHIQKTLDNSATVTIDGNGAETINGETTVVLYVQYDAIDVLCDGSEWFIIRDKRTAHKARMTRSAAQSVANATVTKIAHDNEDYDVGGIADEVTNDRFNIKRAGKYLVVARTQFTASVGATGLVVTYVYKNGSVADLVQIYGYFPIVMTVTVLDCAVNDYIEHYTYQNSGAASNTNTGTFAPSFTIAEIR